METEGPDLSIINSGVPGARPEAETRALHFAVQAHGEQMDKYLKQPYIVHPIKIAQFMVMFEQRTEVVQAALLHDVVEDTKFTILDIRKEFGDDVAGLVNWLTDQYADLKHGNRSLRKRWERERFSNAPADAQTIKYADLIDNANSIFQHDKPFAKVYIREMRETLSVATRGFPVLYALARRVVDSIQIHNKWPDPATTALAMQGPIH
jgi:(p)ppGpp synthase/HD superfamily hydrolase